MLNKFHLLKIQMIGCCALLSKDRRCPRDCQILKKKIWSKVWELQPRFFLCSTIRSLHRPLVFCSLMFSIHIMLSMMILMMLMTAGVVAGLTEAGVGSAHQAATGRTDWMTGMNHRGRPGLGWRLPMCVSSAALTQYLGWSPPPWSGSTRTIPAAYHHFSHSCFPQYL